MRAQLFRKMSFSRSNRSLNKYSVGSQSPKLIKFLTNLNHIFSNTLFAMPIKLKFRFLFSLFFILLFFLTLFQKCIKYFRRSKSQIQIKNIKIFIFQSPFSQTNLFNLATTDSWRNRLYYFLLSSFIIMINSKNIRLNRWFFDYFFSKFSQIVNVNHRNSVFSVPINCQFSRVL